MKNQMIETLLIYGGSSMEGTEVYLGLIAFTIFYNRQKSKR